MRRTKIVVVGDSPNGPTGLGRIARDLITRIDADLEVSVVGWEADSTWRGGDRYYGHRDSRTWGAATLARWWPEIVDEKELGVILSIWDPARCFGLREFDPPNARWWGYFAVDAQNVNGGISGPAAEAIRRYDRVLAYGRYGAGVLRSVRDDVPHLPHGIDDHIFRPRSGEQDAWETLGQLAPTVHPSSILIGCVATNQPRKDLGLVCGAMRELRRRNPDYKLWLHTDQAVTKAWSIPQLLSDFGLQQHTVVTYEMSDAELAAIYSYCAATIAPGLGEGFGYPIVESLACGTPVIHGTYGGGTELIPCPDWLIPTAGMRLEGAYALQRPLYLSTDVANAVEKAVDWRQRDRQVVEQYCVGSIEHLRWERLWSCWKQWIDEGMEAL